MSLFLKCSVVIPPNVNGYFGNTGEGDTIETWLEIPAINTIIDQPMSSYTNNILTDTKWDGNTRKSGLLIDKEDIGFVNEIKVVNLMSYLLEGKGTKIQFTNGSYIIADSVSKDDYNLSTELGTKNIEAWGVKFSFHKPDGSELYRYTSVTSGGNYYIPGTLMPFYNKNDGIAQNLYNNRASISGIFLFIHPNYRDQISNVNDIIELIISNASNNTLSCNNYPILSIGQGLGSFNNYDDYLNNEIAWDKFTFGIPSNSIRNGYDPFYMVHAHAQSGFTFNHTISNVTSNEYMDENWIEFFTGMESTNNPSIVNPGDIPSGPGGGGGTWDDSSDVSGGIDLPTLQGMDLGLISAYKMDSNSMTQLASVLWSESIGSALTSLFQQPLNSIISLSILPIDLTGSSIEIMLGVVGTGVIGEKLLNRFYTVDCGNYTLSEYEGSYMDYNPHTKVSLYLPFIGIVGLNTNEVMGATINIQYAIDILTGQCIAVVTVSKGNLQSVIYNYEGSCIVNVPLTSNNMGQMAKVIVGGLGTAGMGLLSGQPFTAYMGAMTAGAGAFGTALGLGSIQRSGDVNGSAGIMNSKTPYLIIERQIKAYPSDFPNFEGRTSMITYTLSELSGFTQVSNIELEGITATEEELKEIESLLTGGVFL